MNDEFLKLENQLCFRLYAVSRNMTRLYQPLLEAFDLTYPQYIILLILFEHQVIDFKALSQRVDLKTGTLTPIVQKLEERGLVKKLKNIEDGRRLDVILTEEGKAMKVLLASVPMALASRLNMDEEQYLSLTKDLDRLLEQLKEAQPNNNIRGGYNE